MSTQVEKKIWWKSKTVWLSFFTFVYGVISYFIPDFMLDGSTVASVSGILFMVLRFVTGVEITPGEIKKK